MAKKVTNSVYKDSPLLLKLQTQSKNKIFKGKTVIAFTDIDGTYVSSYKEKTNHTIRNFTRSPVIIEFQKTRLIHATHILTEYLDTYSIPIVAVTGRNILGVLEGQPGGRNYLQENLPLFDAICPSLGTHVYIRQKTGIYEKDIEFNKNTYEQSGFDKKSLYPLCNEFMHTMNSRFYGLHMVFQPQDRENNIFKYDVNGTPLIQEEFKLSMYAKKDIVSPDTMQKLFENWLISKGFPHVAVISYTNDDFLCVDIAAFSKNIAVKYLMELTKSDVGIVAGDSGNDKLMILNAPSAAIIPGGASKELIDEIKKIPRSKVTEYLVTLPNGVQIYIEPKDSINKDYYGPESLKFAFTAYLSHLLKVS